MLYNKNVSINNLITNLHFLKAVSGKSIYILTVLAFQKYAYESIYAMLKIFKKYSDHAEEHI